MNPTTIAGRQLAADLPDLAEWVKRIEAEARADVDGLVALREAAEAALTDFMWDRGSDFDENEWPGMAALRALLDRDKAEAPDDPASKLQAAWPEAPE